MKTFVQAARIGDNAAFVAAILTMGWTKHDYHEALNELGDVDGYIVNEDIYTTHLTDVTPVTLKQYTTIGMDGGNSWFGNEVPALLDQDGNYWIDEEIAFDI